ncbi:hypothetical protein GAY33_26875 [Azospirillum brasilense]|nr:hypothetical protein [Azospirillum argentinense]
MSGRQVRPSSLTLARGYRFRWGRECRGEGFPSARLSGRLVP